jgi:hypothetical protein
LILVEYNRRTAGYVHDGGWSGKLMQLDPVIAIAD